MNTPLVPQKHRILRQPPCAQPPTKLIEKQTGGSTELKIIIEKTSGKDGRVSSLLGQIRSEVI